MHFKDIIGRREVKQHLLEMVNQNRLSHALLFLGKEGSGALPLALAFAQYVSLIPSAKAASTVSAGPSLFGDEPVIAAPKKELPQSIDDADEWMQLQPAYSKSAGLVHPDIHFSYPVISKKSGDKPVSTDYITDWREFIKQAPQGNAFDWLQFIGAENKQGNITAEECNDIIHKLSLKSFESDYKILLMWMPEYLGKSGNKLLKLIEEPPPDTLFILVAENEEQILPTILSRCQLVKIPLPENSEIIEALIQKSGASPEAAAQIAAIAEGNYHEALQLIQHAEEDWLIVFRLFTQIVRMISAFHLKRRPRTTMFQICHLSRYGTIDQADQFTFHLHQNTQNGMRVSYGMQSFSNVFITNVDCKIDFIGCWLVNLLMHFHTAHHLCQFLIYTLFGHYHYP